MEYIANKLLEIEDRPLNSLDDMFNYRGYYGQLAFGKSIEEYSYMSHLIEFRVSKEDKNYECVSCRKDYYVCECEPLYVRFPKTIHEFAYIIKKAIDEGWALEAYKGGWTRVSHMDDNYLTWSSDGCEDDDQGFSDVTEDGFLLTDGTTLPYWYEPTIENWLELRNECYERQGKDYDVVTIDQLKELEKAGEQV